MPKRLPPRARAQILRDGEVVRQNFRDAVRPIFYETGVDDFKYGTAGGTCFIVVFDGAVYGLTCRHAIKGVTDYNLCITDTLYAVRRRAAAIDGIFLGANFRGAAAGSDLEDICVIKFHKDADEGFFGNKLYFLDHGTFGSSKRRHILSVFGVINNNTKIEPPNIYSGLGDLVFSDDGVYETDSTLRSAEMVTPHDGSFDCVNGLSGSPVFDETAKKLCGMVVRGSGKGKPRIYYIDIQHIVSFLSDAHSGRATCEYQVSTGS